jgi:hypothetical protein
VPYIYLGRLGGWPVKNKTRKLRKKNCGIRAEIGGDEVVIGMRKGSEEKE